MKLLERIEQCYHYKAMGATRANCMRVKLYAKFEKKISNFIIITAITISTNFALFSLQN